MTVDPLGSAIVLLAASVGAMGLARSLGVSPVIGFFVSGALIGPYGLGLADPDANVLKVLAELGVCFLLFDAGLHISVSHLRKHWRNFFAVGGVQFIIVSSLLATAARLYGLPMVQSLVLGMTLSLSSTAVVLKFLTDHKEEDTPTGRVATEILVFQDLVGIVLLVVLGSLAVAGADVGSVIGWTAGNIALSLLFIGFVGRFLLRPFFKWIGCIGTDEVFTASALLFVLFTCWLTHALGLSLALGAFLAGVALSESTYSYLVRSEVTPFRGLLLSLFFLTVGMAIDVPLVFRHFPAVIGATVVMMGLKTIGMVAALRLVGIRDGAETRLGLLLAQGSEFAFVVLAVAAAGGFVAGTDVAFFSAIVSVSMLSSPLMANLGCCLSRMVARTAPPESESSEVRGEVVIVEFDEIGRQIAEALIAAGIPYRAHDRDWGRIAYGKSRGFNVHYSDLSRPRTIARASVGEVRAVISLAEDDVVQAGLVEGLRKVAPNVPILSATSDPKRLAKYYELGIENAFIKNEHTAELLFDALLAALGYNELAAASVKGRIFREEKPTFFPRGLDPIAVAPALAGVEGSAATVLH